MTHCFIIAEAGVNHNGSVDLALKLIDVAASAGADAVKFQTFTAENLVVRGAEKALYQKLATGSGDQFSMLKALELSESSYPILTQRCKERGIEFMSTPFDQESAKFLVELGMKRIKIPSGEITNLPLIRDLADHCLPIILSTGMSTLDEIADAVACINHMNSITLLHCTSNYPTSFDDVHLRAMQTMRTTFKLPVGYSDHTSGIAIPIAAVALGARVIEKHFTLDSTMIGPDHKASLEPDELKQMIFDIRAVERGLGSSIKQPVANELEMRRISRRSVTLKHEVCAGHIISKEDLVLMRPGNGIAPKEINSVIGKQIKYKMRALTTITWDDLCQ